MLWLSIILFLLVSQGHARAAVLTNKVENHRLDSKPDIIYILVDDLGYGDLGVYGANDIRTPNLDKMAQEGILLTSYYTSSSVCSPSRATILSGEPASEYGIYRAFMYDSLRGLPHASDTIAEILKSSGYQSSFVGKWHLGNVESALPQHHGFDYFFGMPHSHDMKNFVVYDMDSIIDFKPQKQFLTKNIAKKSSDILDSATLDMALFLFSSFTAPHIPLIPTPEFQGSSQRGVYGDVVEELDFYIGKVIESARQRYKRSGRDILIIFTSDNGPRISNNSAESGSTGGLKGKKGFVFEGGFKVPAIISFTSGIAKGTITAPVTASDVYNYLANSFGTSRPSSTKPASWTLSEAINSPLTDMRIRRDSFIHAYPSTQGYIQAVRSGDWKLIRPYKFNEVRNSLFSKSPLGVEDSLLYNLKDDPTESDDLSARHPEKVRELSKIIEDHEINLETIERIDLGITQKVKRKAPYDSRLFKVLIAVIVVLVALVIGYISGRRRHATL